MELNVLYTSDENYARHAGASLYSLLVHNKSFEKINCYFVENKISDGSKAKLLEIVSKFPNSNLKFIRFDRIKDKIRLNDKSGFAEIGYARLLVSDLVPGDKLLYLDCDTIVNSSFEELWMVDLQGYYIAGVQDNPALYNLRVIGMSENDRYVNSGVLLLNLKKWREDALEKRLNEMLDQYNGFVPHHDQGIVNGVCRGYIKILPPKYNCMTQFFIYNANQIKKLFHINMYYSQAELDEAISNPVIIHYISKFYDRPWFKGCIHPYRDKYIEAAQRCGWKVSLLPSVLKKDVKVRFFVFKHFPFFIYTLMEWMLDIKRRRLLKKKYKYLGIKI